METILYIVEDAGIRLDIFLAGQLSERSRSFVQKCIENEEALVNGKKEKSNYRLRKGDQVQLQILPPAPADILPERIPLDIVYEDRELLVVNKPQGMVVHPAPGHEGQTLVNALMYHCGGELSGINGVLRPGIVHRIDRDTSGLLAVAKTDEAHRALAAQLADHAMKRRYEAIAIGTFKQAGGTIDKPIGRHPADRKKMCVNEKNGRRAVTHFQVLETAKGYSHIEARLETGRTHQIRVHMASIGHPLLGDPVYGGLRPGFSLQGQVLHARVLGFIHPVTEKYMEFEAGLPDYFVRILHKLSLTGALP